jgi:hypothetical protein
LESITFDNAGINVEISDIAIYGTYSPDLGSAYPIECKIYREDLQILVTDSLISTLDTNNPHYVFTAQMV